MQGLFLILLWSLDNHDGNELTRCGTALNYDKSDTTFFKSLVKRKIL